MSRQPTSRYTRNRAYNLYSPILFYHPLAQRSIVVSVRAYQKYFQIIEIMSCGSISNLALLPRAQRRRPALLYKCWPLVPFREAKSTSAPSQPAPPVSSPPFQQSLNDALSPPQEFPLLSEASM